MTGEALAAAAGTIGIVDGTTSETTIFDAYGNPAVGSAAQYQINHELGSFLDDAKDATVKDYFAFNAGLRAWTPYAGSAIYVAGNRLSTGTLLQDEALMMHELLHNVYGLDDTDIQRNLGITVNSKNTSNITDWMRENCTTGGGNR